MCSFEPYALIESLQVKNEKQGQGLISELSEKNLPLRKQRIRKAACDVKEILIPETSVQQRIHAILFYFCYTELSQKER